MNWYTHTLTNCLEQKKQKTKRTVPKKQLLKHHVCFLAMGIFLVILFLVCCTNCSLISLAPIESAAAFLFGSHRNVVTRAAAINHCQPNFRSLITYFLLPHAAFYTYLLIRCWLALRFFILGTFFPFLNWHQQWYYFVISFKYKSTSVLLPFVLFYLSAIMSKKYINVRISSVHIFICKPN